MAAAWDRKVIAMLWLLLVGHYVADYPLQGNFLALAKNAADPFRGVPWWQAMFAHACIHSGAVLIVTGSLLLAGAELIAHFVIDHAKCCSRISFNVDQALHIACKVVWVGIYYGAIQ